MQWYPFKYREVKKKVSVSLKYSKIDYGLYDIIMWLTWKHFEY